MHPIAPTLGYSLRHIRAAAIIYRTYGRFDDRPAISRATSNKYGARSERTREFWRLVGNALRCATGPGCLSQHDLIVMNTIRDAARNMVQA